MTVKALLALALLAASCRPPQASENAPVSARAPQQCVRPAVVLVRPGQMIAPNSTYYSAGNPPERYRSDNHAEVVFMSQNEIERECGNGAPPTCGLQIKACQKGGRIIMPNPCASATEYYGRILCHELGHLNGWPGTHGD